LNKAIDVAVNNEYQRGPIKLEEENVLIFWIGYREGAMEIKNTAGKNVFHD